ncbi:hypothetical protein ACQJBY_029740 [Aegilops geniculata]
MAAAPAGGEVPTPLSAPVLPSMAAAPTRVEVPTPLAAPVPPSMAAAGWSSLPTDLVPCIADCLLDTNDVDCYVDLRAVCHNWRSATEDPRSDASDPRFHPRFWIVLDDDGAFQSDGCRVLVNTATGRFLRKQLPLPRHYYVVITTVSGFFVLADRSPPHAARVLNPLTGAVVGFIAPLPRDASVAVFLFCGGTSHNLTVLCDSTRKYYTAVPESKRFAPVTTNDVMYNYMRKAVVAASTPMAAAGHRWRSLMSSWRNCSICQSSLRSISSSFSLSTLLVIAAMSGVSYWILVEKSFSSQRHGDSLWFSASNQRRNRRSRLWRPWAGMPSSSAIKGAWLLMPPSSHPLRQTASTTL